MSRVNIFKKEGGRRTGGKVDREAFSSNGSNGRRLDPDAYSSGGGRSGGAPSPPHARRTPSPWAAKTPTAAAVAAAEAAADGQTPKPSPSPRGHGFVRSTLEAAAGLMLRPSSRVSAVTTAADGSRWTSEAHDGGADAQVAGDELDAILAGGSPMMSAAPTSSFEVMPSLPPLCCPADDGEQSKDDLVLGPVLPVVGRRRASEAAAGPRRSTSVTCASRRGSNSSRKLRGSSTLASTALDSLLTADESEKSSDEDAQEGMKARSSAQRLSALQLDEDFGRLFELAPQTSESFSINVVEPEGLGPARETSFASMVLKDVEHKERVEREAACELNRKYTRPIWDDEENEEESMTKDVSRVRGKLRAITIYQGNFLAANMSQDEWRDDELHTEPLMGMLP